VLTKLGKEMIKENYRGCFTVEPPEKFVQILDQHNYRLLMELRVHVLQHQ